LSIESKILLTTISIRELKNGFNGIFNSIGTLYESQLLGLFAWMAFNVIFVGFDKQARKNELVKIGRVEVQMFHHLS
jgi:hypothetical protein